MADSCTYWPFKRPTVKVCMGSSTRGPNEEAVTKRTLCRKDGGGMRMDSRRRAEVAASNIAGPWQ